MNSDHVVFVGSNDALSHLEGESVSLTVTSPPYVVTKFEKGQEFDYLGFLRHFAAVAKQVFRVTIPGGTFALNVADIITKYRYGEKNGFYRIPLGSDLLRLCQRAGFRLLERYIWDKGYTRNFGGPLLGSYPYPPTLYNNNYFEYIYVLRKPGKRLGVDQSLREKSRISLEEWRAWTQKWWRIESVTEKVPYHPSVFPVEIPYRLIRMYSYVGDLVLDPYLGTGSTLIAAHYAGRRSVGYEISPECPNWLSLRIAEEISRTGRPSPVYEIRELES